MPLLADAQSLMLEFAELHRCGAEFPTTLLRAALLGPRFYAQQGELDRPASSRLAFRELGRAIGLDWRGF